MLKKTLILITFSLLVINVFADKRKDPLNIPVKVNYALPRTTLEVKVTLERKVFRKGQFSKYAQQFFGVDNSEIISKDGEKWNIKDVKIVQKSESDPEQLHSISMIQDYSGLRLKLSPEGFLTGLNTTNDKSSDKLINSKFKVAETKDIQQIMYSKFSIDRPYRMVEDTLKRLPQNVVIKGANISMYDFIGKTEEEKAKEAAHIIYKLRKRRFKILTSNYKVLPPDGKAYDIMVKELKKLENKYLELFLGKEYTEKVSQTYTVTPKKGTKAQTVTRYSTTKGFVSVNDVSGLPVIMEYHNIVSHKNAPATAETTGTADTQGGYIYYRIPASADIHILSGREIIGTQNIIIPQLGTVEKLSAKVILDEELNVEFYKDYGSVKNIYKKK